MKVMDITDLSLIKIKQFLTYEEKANLVQNMVENCIERDTDDGAFYIDYVLKEGMFHILILVYYTDLDIELKDMQIIELYNYCTEHGIFEYVEKSLPHYELKSIGTMIEGALRSEITKRNHISLTNILSLLSSLAPKDLSEVEKIIKEFDKNVEGT